MLQVAWHIFKKKKPKTQGWYLCTVYSHYSDYKFGRQVIMLYYYPSRCRFINKLRQDVFATHRVNGIDNRWLRTDTECDRTEDVIAWRKLPRVYKKTML